MPKKTQLSSPQIPTEIGTAVKRSKRGKRSDPNYEPISAYIKRQTHRDVKIALLNHAEKKDFSDLLEELLTAWLNDQTV